MAVLGVQAKGRTPRTAISLVLPWQNSGAALHILDVDTCAIDCRLDLASLARVSLRGPWSHGELETSAEAQAVLNAIARDSVAEQLRGPRRT
jgi:hypothetical protein